MPISNKVKGYISLAQGIFLSIGALQMFQDPHSYAGLIIMIVGAIIGATKHWADTQDTPDNTVPPSASQ